MHVTRQDFLAGAGIAGDQHRGVAGGDLLRQLDHARHGVVAVDQFAPVVGDGGQHRGDQFGVGRQRDIFLGAGLNGRDRGARIGGGAAGDDRRMNVLGFEASDQIADVDGDVDHQEVGAASGAQHRERLGDIRGMGDQRALVHRELGRGGELAVERADDQKAHLVIPSSLSAANYDLSALIISVMVTPSLSSTRTTSPRATRRLLT